MEKATKNVNNLSVNNSFAEEKHAPFFKPAGKIIQRKCAHCEQEEKMLHRKESSVGEVGGSSQLDNYVSSLSTTGQTISAHSRQFFEPRFGHDFSRVRIHTDSGAAKSAQSINALAYTTGNNIVFNSGQYSPETPSGQRLMAHELTHVVQQGAKSSMVQRLSEDEKLDGGLPPGGTDMNQPVKQSSSSTPDTDPSYCPSPAPEVNDNTVQMLINNQLKAFTDKTGKLDAGGAWYALFKLRNVKENCCDVNLAAAERYMYARKEMAEGRTRAYQGLLNVGDYLWKSLELPFPNSGICPKTQTSSAQLSWAFKGTRDGTADWNAAQKKGK